MAWSLVYLHALDAENEDRGQRYHRMERPAASLTASGEFDARVVSWNHPGAVAVAVAADLLVVHSLTEYALFAVIEERRRKGLPTLYEIADEIAAARPWLPSGGMGAIERGLLCNVAARCDGIQCSSEALRERYGGIAARSAVLPNAVPLRPMPAKPEVFTIGWAGTRSHREDLRAIAPALTGFLHRHPEVRLALKSHPSMLREVFAAAPPAQVEIEAFGSMESYRAFLDRLHVGLVPLSESSFNHGRTALKIFEYAAAGAAVMAQDAAPYRPHAEHVMLFRTPEEMVARLEELVQDRAALEKSVEKMRAHAAGYVPEVSDGVHREWYLSFVAGRPQHPLPGMEDSPLRMRAAELIAAQRSGKDVRAELRTLAEDDGEFLQPRLALVEQLARMGEFAEAEAMAASLLASAWFHDAAILSLLRGSSPERAAWRGRIRDAALRLEAEPTVGKDLFQHFAQVLEGSPYHYFALGYMAKRGAAASGEQREIWRRRLALLAD